MLTPAHSPQMALLSSVFLFFGGICAIAWHTSEKADDDELRVCSVIVSRAPPAVVECSRRTNACVRSLGVGKYCGRIVLHGTRHRHRGLRVEIRHAGAASAGHTSPRAWHRAGGPVRVCIFLWPHHHPSHHAGTCRAVSLPAPAPCAPDLSLVQLSTGIANIYAVHRGEYSNKVYRMKFSRKPGIHDEMLARMTITQRLQWWWDRQREADNVAKVWWPAVPLIALHTALTLAITVRVRLYCAAAGDFAGVHRRQPVDRHRHLGVLGQQHCDAQERGQGGAQLLGTRCEDVWSAAEH